MTKHIRYKHKGFKYPCQECDYKGANPNCLKLHVDSIHRGIKFPCDLCDYKSTQRSNLTTHKKKKHSVMVENHEEKQISDKLDENIQKIPISFISKNVPDEIIKSKPVIEFPSPEQKSYEDHEILVLTLQDDDQGVKLRCSECDYFAKNKKNL